jgi:hypothetical protein
MIYLAVLLIAVIVVGGWYFGRLLERVSTRYEERISEMQARIDGLTMQIGSWSNRAMVPVDPKHYAPTGTAPVPKSMSELVADVVSQGSGRSGRGATWFTKRQPSTPIRVVDSEGNVISSSREKE